MIKVSQELKGKEYEMRDYNYQISQDKEHLSKQVEVVKREMLEEKDRREKLEMIETDMLGKLQNREQENERIKICIGDLEDKLSYKTEAIEKA